MRPLATLGVVLASAALLARAPHEGAPEVASGPYVQAAGRDTPFPAPLPGSRLTGTKQINEPLELKPATAEDEAVIAGQSYVQHSYDSPHHITAVDFIQFFRDALFGLGWKLIDVTKLDESAIQPETVHVSAHYLQNGRNVYARFTQEPGRPYHVNVADVGAEDWAAQLEQQCRVRIHSIHFEHDRADIRLIESEPTLRKLAGLIAAKHTPAVEVQGHVDNIGEAAAPAREMLSMARAKAVAGWLTSEGGVPAKKVIARGLGKARPIADNDTDLGRALNRRIEVARLDCAR